jgi:hypothetical protein
MMKDEKANTLKTEAVEVEEDGCAGGSCSIWYIREIKFLYDNQ